MEKLSPFLYLEYSETIGGGDVYELSATVSPVVYQDLLSQWMNLALLNDDAWVSHRKEMMGWWPELSSHARWVVSHPWGNQLSL